MIRRLLFAILTVWTLVVFALPGQAFGHAKLVQTEPAADSRLDSSPALIRVAFNQELEVLAKDALILKDERGAVVNGSEPSIGADGSSVEMPVSELAAGRYTVQYSVLSLDGHAVKGSFQFTVNETSVSSPETETPADPMPSTDHTGANGEHLHHDPIQAANQTVEGKSIGELLDGVRLDEALKILFYIVFLPLAGLVLWGVFLRGRTDEQTRQLRAWTLHLQRGLFLVLLGVIAEYVSQTVGFDDWKAVQSVLTETTTGLYWVILLILSLLGMFVLQRAKFIDAVWLIAAIAAKTQIGHAAADDERLTASIMAGIHLISAAIWTGGLLLLLLLWGRFRYEAEKLLPVFSSASITALFLLTVSGLASSALYLPDLTYLVESRWGLMLIGKLIVVVLVGMTGSVIRNRLRRRSVNRIGSLLKLDLLLMILIALFAGLLSSSEPIPANEPIHWHVMGEDVHMTADITPPAPGKNRFGVTVWLPEGSGKPQNVELRVFEGKTGKKSDEVPLEIVEGTSDLVFTGFDEYHYEAMGDQINHAGWWRIVVSVTDAKGQVWEYQRTQKIY